MTAFAPSMTAFSARKEAPEPETSPDEPFPGRRSMSTPGTEPEDERAASSEPAAAESEERRVPGQSTDGGTCYTWDDGVQDFVDEKRRLPTDGGTYYTWDDEVQDFVNETRGRYGERQMAGREKAEPQQESATKLDPDFRVVEKPKRFFSVGRIFKTVWFEPAGQTSEGDDWTSSCPGFHDERPFAKFRWFVVVKRRLHHSLCFSIGTFGGRGATKTSRGRARDFVVLYPASVEAPDAYPEEEITRRPIAVIVEGGGQRLSPLARLDCARIYTVEDNLRVVKLGRVHPDSLGDLEEYYRESVA